MDSDSVVQMQGIDFQGQDYHLLETYLGMPLVDHKYLSRLVRLYQRKEAYSADLPASCCILFEVDQDNNSAVKAAEIALHTVMARRTRRKLARLTGNRSDIVGIYPTLKNPSVIFELDTLAADYVHRDVLPGFGSSLTATVKRLLATLIKADPSLSGIGVIVRFR